MAGILRRVAGKGSDRRDDPRGDVEAGSVQLLGDVDDLSEQNERELGRWTPAG
jgi:hypothetical protein